MLLLFVRYGLINIRRGGFSGFEVGELVGVFNDVEGRGGFGGFVLVVIFSVGGDRWYR